MEKTLFYLIFNILFHHRQAQPMCFRPSFPNVFQSADPATQTDNHFEAIAADEAATAIFVGGTSSQSDLVSANQHAVVARIDLVTMDYVWTKLYSDPNINLLFQVTALAVNGLGTQVAIHASDTSQSIVNPSDANTRKYTGSLYSYIFTVMTDTGSSASSLMRITHGSSVDSSSYTVWSSGFRLHDDGRVMLAFNMHLEDWTNAVDGYESRLRVGCFNTASGVMDYYQEQQDWYGRSASIAWRISPDNGFFLGGNADEALNDNKYKLSINSFDNTGQMDASYLITYQCSLTSECMNDGYNDPATAPYIDHMHTCTKNGQAQLIGTTGHTNNHDGDHQGYMPMVFVVELDQFAEVTLSTFSMVEISNSGTNQFNYQSYITAVKDSLDFDGEVHILFHKVETPGLTMHGLYYIAVDPNIVGIGQKRSYKVADGDVFYQSVFVGQLTGLLEANGFSMNAQQSYAVGSISSMTLAGGDSFNSAYTSAAVMAILPVEKCESINQLEIEVNIVHLIGQLILVETPVLFANLGIADGVVEDNTVTLAVEDPQVANLYQMQECQEQITTISDGSYADLPNTFACWCYESPLLLSNQGLTYFNPPKVQDNCIDIGAWDYFVQETDAKGIPLVPDSNLPLTFDIDNIQRTVLLSTPDDGFGNYPGTSSTDLGGMFYYQVTGFLPDGSTANVVLLNLNIDFCVPPTMVTAPSSIADQTCQVGTVCQVVIGPFTSDNAKCNPTSPSVNISPNPRLQTFFTAQDDLTHDWFAADNSLIGQYTLTVTFGQIICEPAEVISMSYIMNIVDCSSSTLSIVYPVSFIASSYILGDPSLQFQWDQTVIASNSLGLNCGDYGVTFFQNGLPLDNVFFQDDRTPPLNSFNVLYSEDTGLVGSWTITYEVFLDIMPTISVLSGSSFTILVTDPCQDPSNQMTAGSLGSKQTYILTDNPLFIDLTGVFTTDISWCPIIYSYVADNTEVDIAITLDGSNVQPSFTCSYFDDIGDMMATNILSKDYQITITASASATAIDNLSFSLTIENPCPDSAFNAITAQASLDPTYTVTYNIGTNEQAYSSWKSAFQLTIPQCGDLYFTITDSIGTLCDSPASNVVDILTSPSSLDTSMSLTVSTNDILQQGDYLIQVQAFSEVYPVIFSTPPIGMTLQLRLCSVSNVLLPTVDTWQIVSDGNENELQIDVFVANAHSSCILYTWEYEAFYEGDLIEDSSLSEILTFDPVERLFLATTSLGEATYEILLIGTCSDQLTIAEVSFNIEVANMQDSKYNITEPTLPGVLINNPPSIEGIEAYYYVPRIVDESGTPLIEFKSNVTIGTPNDEENDAFESQLTCATEECQGYFTFHPLTGSIVISEDALDGEYDISLTLKETKRIAPQREVYSLVINIVTMLRTSFRYQDQFPTLFISSITNLGKVEVQFTEQLNFIENLAMINQTALNITILEAADDTDLSLKAFNWTVTNFTIYNMLLQLDFEHPVHVSSGKKDVLQITVLDQHPFQSNGTNVRMPSGTQAQRKIPGQLINNELTSRFFTFVTTFDIAAQTALASNFVINLMVTGVLNYLWGMIRCMQIIGFFSIIDLLMPANSYEVFQVFAKIATFDLIPVDGIIDWINNFLQIPEAEEEHNELRHRRLSEENDDDIINDNFIDFGFETSNPVINLQIIFLFLLGLLILPIITKIIDLICLFSPQATQIIQKFKSNYLYWNIYLRFFFEVYLELSIVSLIRIYDFNFNSVGDTVLTVMALVLIALLLTYIGFSFWFLRANHRNIRDQPFENSYGALVVGLRDHDLSPMHFPSAFMTYRLFYAMNIVFLQRKNYFQIQILVFTQSLMMIFEGQVRPCRTPQSNTMTLLNESVTLLCTYALFCFTPWVPDDQARFDVGWALIAATVFIIAVNMFVLFYQSITTSIRAGRLKMNKRKYMSYKKQSLQRQNMIFLQDKQEGDVPQPFVIQHLGTIQEANKNSRIVEQDSSLSSVSDLIRTFSSESSNTLVRKELLLIDQAVQQSKVIINSNNSSKNEPWVKQVNAFLDLNNTHDANQMLTLPKETPFDERKQRPQDFQDSQDYNQDFRDSQDFAYNPYPTTMQTIENNRECTTIDSIFRKEQSLQLIGRPIQPFIKVKSSNSSKKLLDNIGEVTIKKQTASKQKYQKSPYAAKWH